MTLEIYCPDCGTLMRPVEWDRQEGLCETRLICPGCMHVETVYSLEGDDAIPADMEQPVRDG